MSSKERKVLPDVVISAFLWLVPVGVVLGVLTGAGVISGPALVLVVFGGLTGFVPWAVLKLDPLGVSETSDERSS